jgi:hypothetical protein
MKINKTLCGLYSLYAILIAIQIFAVRHAKSRADFWVAVGFIVWIVLLSLYVYLKFGPIIQRPKEYGPSNVTYTQPILAWRMWRMVGGQLQSLYCAHRGSWIPKTQITAACFQCTNVNKKPMPQSDCTCGIYAKKEMDYSFYHVNKTIHGTAADPAGLYPDSHAYNILGLVWLWGNIIEGEDGYRAEFAYPASLVVVNDEHEDRIRGMAANYGIPCVKLTWWENKRFKSGGTRWISEKLKESLRSNLLSFPFQQNPSENRVA